MCEITCENFYTELPGIEEALKQSSFVCIDMEFSKIDETIYKPYSYFDMYEDRYRMLREKVENITCIQLGLSIFTYDINNKKFKASAYSIYTYPQTFYKSDSVVHFQTSCVEFLNKYKFNFNKLFSQSVPYLTDEQELTIQTEMLSHKFFDEYFKNDPRFRTVKEELNKMLNIIFNWYDSADYGDNAVFEINECNEPAYIILMQYHLLKKYKNITIDEVPSGLIITKIEQNEDLDELYTKLKQSLLGRMMGIKYLFKLLFKLKKPIIGHNCALDILILYKQFFHPLPDTFKDFQQFVSNNFGPIYDTKLLCKELKRIVPKTHKWKGNCLPEIYSYLKNGDGYIHSNLVCIELFGIDEPDNMKLHHAGWDAYYTGFCFIKIIHIIKNISNKTETIYQTYTLTELLTSIESFKNKLYTHRSISNIIDLKTGSSYDQINCLIVQNKGIFYKSLNIPALAYRLNEICTFDIKVLSKYSALIITPFPNRHVINDMKSDYMIEEYSDYQNRKKKQYLLGLSLFILSTPVIILAYLHKY